MVSTVISKLHRVAVAKQADLSPRKSKDPNTDFVSVSCFGVRVSVMFHFYDVCS